MKNYLLFFSLILLAVSANAQKKDLMIRKGLAGLYLEHKVSPKESFFAIGRMYNVSPPYLAVYNKLEIRDGLFIDQKLRIPLTDTNFIQEGNSGTPLYYKTDDKDNLPALGVKYNNVPLEKLKYWNNITDDNVRPGTKLMVGFLKGSEFPVVTINAPAKTEEKINEAIEPAVNKTTETKPEEKPEEKTTVKTEEPIKQEEKPAVKTEEPPAVKPEEKTAAVIEEKLVTGQGYFKSHFDQQVRIAPASKNEIVTSGIFKTLSGWQDAKYYLLIDKVPPGTIVKVTNPINNKAVYAKVLGEMSGIRQNEGLNIRISNAAASALEISEEDKFIVNVNY